MLRTAEAFDIVDGAAFAAAMEGMGELPVSEIIDENVAIDMGQDVADEEA